MFKLIVLAVILAVATAGPVYNAPYGGNVHYGYAAHVQDYNGLRQAHVNNIAEHVGAGIGTADYNGVPGTHVRKANGYYAGPAHAYAGGYGFHGYNLHPGYATAVH